MKKTLLFTVCFLSFNFVHIVFAPPKEQKVTINKQLFDALQKKASSRKNEISNLYKRTQEQNKYIEQLELENKNLMSALQANQRYKTQQVQTIIQNTLELVEVNLEHIAHPQFEITNISGGHEAGSMERLSNQGIIGIRNTEEFNNGCKKIVIQQPNGTIYTKTEFPPSWSGENIASKLTDPNNITLHEIVDKKNDVIRLVKTLDNVVAKLIFRTTQGRIPAMISAYPILKQNT